MATGLIGPIILWLIVAIIIIVVVAYLLNWLYHRSTKELAFVRTGFGGETVVIDGGALVLPIIHQVTPVNLNVVRIAVSRAREEAVITRDRMRVDIEAEFFVRVVQERAAVAAAASTLGRRTLDPEGLADLLSGKFVSALRSVATQMTLDDIHEKRGDFISAVGVRAAEVLTPNGLELESVAITGLDQTMLEFFNPANRFDAEGLTQLIEEIEARRKARNDIEQTAMVAIRSRNLEAEKETLQIDRESESSRIDQERAIEAMRAEQRTAIVREQVAREAEAQQSRIATERETTELEIERRKAIEMAEIRTQEALQRERIAQEQAIEQARIEREKLVRAEQIRQRHETEIAEIGANEDIERARVVSERQVRGARIAAEEETESREITRGEQIETTRIAANQAVEAARIAHDQDLDTARIERDRRLRSQQIAQRQSTEEAEIAAQEEIERARIASERGLDEARVLRDRDLKRLEIDRERAVEVAEIDRQIAVRQKEAEEADARVATEVARARAAAAEEQVATTRETEVAERIAAVDRLIAAKDADLARIAAEADKVTAAVAAEGQRLRNEAENVLSDDARAASLRSRLIDRLESIVRESVRPMEKIDGIRILHVDGLGGADGGDTPRSPTDEVIRSALRYRAQAPLIDGIMKEIGVENPNVAGMGDIFRSARDAQSLVREAARKEQEESKGEDES